MLLSIAWIYEECKWDIYKYFFQWDYDSCIKECKTLINRNDFWEDIGYEIYWNIFKWLSLESLWYINEAIDCYMIVDKIIINNDIVLDDLWIYFFLWLAKTKLLYFSKKDYKFEEIFILTKKWFEVFPNSEYDFKDDLESNLRLNCIIKYSKIIDYIFNPFWARFTLIKDNEWNIMNMWLIDNNKKLIAMFWYKRADYYWNQYKDKTYRDNYDNLRNSMMNSIDNNFIL